MTHELDRCIWNALSGRQAAFSHGTATALRYGTEYAPFAATFDHSPASLPALHEILPRGESIALFTRDELTFPETFSVTRRALVEQMVLTSHSLPGGVPALPPTTRELRDDDVPAMMALVSLTQPGPFAKRTIRLGRYLGVFIDDVLAAMAGERMCLDGFVEISAVCTHPNHRGKALAAALIVTLARAAFDRSETPFLHVFADNAPALAVYRKLGFAKRATFHLAMVGSAGDVGG